MLEFALSLLSHWITDMKCDFIVSSWCVCWVALNSLWCGGTEAFLQWRVCLPLLLFWCIYILQNSQVNNFLKSKPFWVISRSVAAKELHRFMLELLQALHSITSCEWIMIQSRIQCSQTEITLWLVCVWVHFKMLKHHYLDGKIIKHLAILSQQRQISGEIKIPSEFRTCFESSRNRRLGSVKHEIHIDGFPREKYALTHPSRVAASPSECGKC